MKNYFEKFFAFLLLVSAILIILTIFSCKKKESPDSTQDTIRKLRDVTDSVIENTDVPGIVALVSDKKKGIDWIYAAGYSNLETKAPMDENHTFRMASISKTFVGTVALQMVDEGKIKLEDKISPLFPEYAFSNQITLAMLLGMTSGIYDYTYDDRFLYALNHEPLTVWTREQLLELSLSHGLSFPPGTSWEYSNTNYTVLGLIIEKLSGNTLEEEIQRRIIEPLHLKNTGFLVSGTTFPGDHGRGYYSEDAPEVHDATEYADISNLWACGSGYSNPRDLQKFAERLVGGGFLSDSLQHRRLSEKQWVGGIFGYSGLSILQLGSFYGHGGIIWGYTTAMYHSIEKECTVVIYFNCDRSKTIIPGDLFLRFAEILYGADY